MESLTPGPELENSLGQARRSRRFGPMSAVPPIATGMRTSPDVCDVPKAAVSACSKCGQAARATRVSISLRSAGKSIGLVSRASAPRSSAVRLVSASP